MKPTDPDARKGAIEGDRPDQPQQSNPNAGALDENGLPAKPIPICEDVLGANVDQNARHSGASGAAEDATETGPATDAKVRP
ncbi:MAG: hypothetical protein ACM3NQ_04635 [Bacteroidales bacterium]